ncbi:MAG TPA: homocysteine S-methyltransferase family protein [Nocardioidaceae bacterium]|nr:homocysteine S-methyltransferase family protein [Nocardioidaceae bacterium]
MNRLAKLLDGREWVLFDGGMGTLLQERGLDEGRPGELWNVEEPEKIRAIHEEYAAAGAAVLTTNTFGGTRPRLAMHGLGDRVVELNRAAAEIARSVAAEHGALVAGDLGPTGELLSPLGTLDPADAQAIFEEQLTGLVAGGIDLVLIETMSDLGEVSAAVDAARAVAPDLPTIATLSFDTNLRTMMGVTPAQAVVSLAESGVEAAGANCGRGLEEMEQIAEQLAAARPEGSDVLLIAQSNAGLPVLMGDRFGYDVPVSDLADHARRLHGIGIDLIGACCGSTPAHLAAMREALAVA